MWTAQKKYGSIDLKRVFVLILGVATFSFLLSYQLGQRVLYIEAEETGTNARDSQGRTFLNEVSHEKNFGRSLNMHASINDKKETKPTSLFSRLLQVEEKLLEKKRRGTIGMVGLSGCSETDVLSRLRVKGAVPGQTFESVKVLTEAESGQREVVIQGNYSMILCVGDSKVCPESIRSTAGDIQRTNRIMAIEKELWDSTQLCKLAKVIQQPTEQNDNRHEQPCHDLREKAAETIESDRTTYPILVAHNRSDSIISVQYNTTISSFLESKDHTDITTMWTFSTTPLTYQSGPALRLEVFITSYTPLRFYISPAGSSGPLEVLLQPDLFGEQTTLEDILQHVGEKYGLSASSHWWNTVQILLMKTLVSVEMSSQNHAASDRCLKCFGAYTIVIVCTNIRQCFILQMMPLMSDKASRVDLLGPLLQLLTSEKMAAMDVLGALENAQKLSDFRLCMGQTILTECLTDDILAYFLAGRRESLESTDLVKIYPTASSSIFTPFLCNLKTSSPVTEHQYGLTYNLHPLLMEMEKYYTRLEADIPDHWDISDETELYETDINFQYMDTRAPAQATRRIDHSCTTDKAFYRELSDIQTEPVTQLHQYSKDEYHAAVEYDTILIKVTVTARHCCCEVRLGDLLEPARPTNFTLGLGENVVRLLLVDTTYQEPKLIRTVKLHLFRETRGLREIVQNVEVLRTCYLRQDCSLPFSQSVACGIQDKNISWGQFNAIEKPACHYGDTQGAWAVPCADCRSEKSCYWDAAKWQPDTCRYRHLSTESIRKCLDKKNILFIGDSTNRGIMHFLVERTNGTLNSMDKTHTLKTYPDLNRGKTNMAFAYYPHFWLPVKHRPKFNKVIYQLIKRSLPLGNNATTVLVVGGVHWLAKRHIDVILSALRRTGLSNITKVVKGLGAGFHQNINGVRFVTKENQAKLLIREREVLQYAKQHNFKVVGTFNMTMARYKDFTEGKCACHFHRISKRKDTHEQLYTVEGDINTEYSHILLHNICNIS